MHMPWCMHYCVFAVVMLPLILSVLFRIALLTLGIHIMVPVPVIQARRKWLNEPLVSQYVYCPLGAKLKQIECYLVFMENEFMCQYLFRTRPNWHRPAMWLHPALPPLQLVSHVIIWMPLLGRILLVVAYLCHEPYHRCPCRCPNGAFLSAGTFLTANLHMLTVHRLLMTTLSKIATDTLWLLEILHCWGNPSCICLRIYLPNRMHKHNQ